MHSSQESFSHFCQQLYNFFSKTLQTISPGPSTTACTTSSFFFFLLKTTQHGQYGSCFVKSFLNFYHRHVAHLFGPPHIIYTTSSFKDQSCNVALDIFNDINGYR